MKFIRSLAVMLLCCLLLAIPAMALSTATDVTGNATVATDGSCLIELTVTLQLDSAQSGLAFPLPVDAEDVLLNGQATNTHLSDGKLQVSLPDLSAGRHTFLLRYSLPAVLQVKKEQTVLSLPLLSGFRLPIAQMNVTVSLPGTITGRPVFYSGYYQENIRLQTTITENTLVAATTESLKDHETLRLEMVCSAITALLAATMVSVPRWGWAPWLPLPRKVTVKVLLAALTAPNR